MIKNKIYLIFLIIITLFSSCFDEYGESNIKFLEPQPENKRDLKDIPDKYQGQYIDKWDSSTLIIENDMIYQEWIQLSTIPVSDMYDELDTIYYEDTEVKIGKNWTRKIDIEGDSVTVLDHIIDSIFVHNQTNKIRKFKGYLFLNKLNPDSTWNVLIMKIDDDQLEINYLVGPEDIDIVKEITFVITEMDTAINMSLYYLEPSRMELKEILGMKELEYRFIRIIEK